MDRGWIATLVALVGCGPSPHSQVDLAPLCGEADGPVQILELAADEVVAPVGYSVAEHDGRWLYAIRTFDPLPDLLTISWSAVDVVPNQVRARIESVDPCGADRRVVAEGLDRILPPAEAGEPWLGFRDRDAELWTFDPNGDRPARRLATTGPPWYRIVRGRDVFVHRYDERDVARLTVTDDAIEIETLVTEVTTQTTSQGVDLGTTETILVLRDDGDLLELDLASGSTALLHDDVQYFGATGGGRWIVYAPGVPPPDIDELPHETWLLDRQTGTDEIIAADAEHGIRSIIYGSQVWSSFYADRTFVRTEVLDLPHRLVLTLDEWSMSFGGGDGRFVVNGNGGATIYGPVDGELVPLAGPFQVERMYDGALWHDDDAPYEGREPARFDIVKIPLADPTPRVVREGLYSHVELPGNRWAWQTRLLDDFVDGLAPIQVIDGETGQPRVLEASAAAGYEPLLPHAPLAHSHVWATDELVYQVRDEGRTGLWRVRFE